MGGLGNEAAMMARKPSDPVLPRSAGGDGQMQEHDWGINHFA